MTALMRSLEVDECPDRVWPVVVSSCRGRMTLEEVDPDAHLVRGHTLPNAVSRLRLGVEVSLTSDESSCTVRAMIEDVAHRRFGATAEVWWEGMVGDIDRGLHPVPPPPEPEVAPVRAWAVSGAGLVVGLGVVALGVDVSLHSPSVFSVVVSAGAAVLSGESLKALVRDRGRRPPFAGAPSEESDRA